MLEKEKCNVSELERTLQNKLFEFDAHIQNERMEWTQRLDEVKIRTEEVTQNLAKSNQ